MNKQILGVTLLALTIAGCTTPTTAPVRVTAPTPPELVRSEALYTEKCSGCHGERALGTPKGPTFLNAIYRPNHHGDGAFQAAVLRGVQAHHWNFGPMPPIPNVSPYEVTQITAYVRWLQQQAGIR